MIRVAVCGENQSATLHSVKGGEFLDQLLTKYILGFEIVLCDGDDDNDDVY